MPPRRQRTLGLSLYRYQRTVCIAVTMLYYQVLQATRCPSGTFNIASASKGMHRRFTHSSFNVKTSVWEDLSTNAEHGNAHVFGHRDTEPNKVNTTCATGHGATAKICFVRGSSQSRVDFGPNSVSSNFTICSVSRYLSSNDQGTVISAFDIKEWAHGHASGFAGVAFYGNKYGTRQRKENNMMANADWLIMCGQNDGRRKVIAGDIEWTISIGGIGGVQMGINPRRHHASGWAIMEITTWNQSLMPHQMRKIIDHYTSILNGTSPQYNDNPICISCGHCPAGKISHCSDDGDSRCDTVNVKSNATINPPGKFALHALQVDSDSKLLAESRASSNNDPNPYNLNNGFYVLQAPLAYYAFNPDSFTVDSSKGIGDLAISYTPPLPSAGSPTGWPRNVASFTLPYGTRQDDWTSQYFALPPFTVPATYSICVWYMPGPCPSSGTGRCDRTWERIIDFGDGNHYYGILICRPNSGSDMAVHMYVRGIRQVIATFPSGFVQNQWYHICTCVDGSVGVAKIYQDGELAGSYSMPNALFSSATYTNAFVGRSNWWSDPNFFGEIDELRIYGKVLSWMEVQAVYSYRGDGSISTLIVACLQNLCPSGMLPNCTSTGVFNCVDCVGVCSSGFKWCTGVNQYVCCHPGSIFTVLNTTSFGCQTCPAGTWSNGNATTCTKCPSESYSLGGSSRCEVCEAPKYSIEGSSTCKSCDVGKVYSIEGNFTSGTYNKCFKFFHLSILVDWYLAEAKCVEYGGHLASINSEAENIYAISQIPPQYIHESVWIGYTSKDKLFQDASSFAWSDGSSQTYENWYSGEPNFFDSETCTVIQSATEASWNNLPCANARNAFLCSAANCNEELRTVTCISCRAGKYVSAQDLPFSACTACSEGKFTSALAQSACASCNAGTYSTGIGISVTTTPNAVSSGGRVFAVLDGTDPDDYSQNCQSDLLVLPPGWILANNDAISQDVIASHPWGTFFLVLSDGCAYNTFSSEPYLLSCGLLFTDSGSYAPEYCNGRLLIEMESSSCTGCESGKYATVSGATSSAVCIDCDAGAFSNGHASTCSLCPQGRYSNQSQAGECKLCAAGKFASSFGSLTCKTCKSGTYGSGSGYTTASKCAACPLGTFDNQSASKCLSCPPGSITNIKGKTSCLTCTFGKFQLSGSTCSLCTAGTFSNVSGAISVESCNPCELGSSSDHGASTCSTCPAGKYNNISATKLTSDVICTSECAAPCTTTCFTGKIRRSNYKNFEVMNWTIIAPPDSLSITFQCSFFDTELNYDFLSVWICDDVECNLFTRLQSWSGTTLPSPLTSDTRVMVVKWTSDDSVTRSGFECSYNAQMDFSKALCLGCLPGTFNSEISSTVCTKCQNGFYTPNSGHSTCISCPKGSYFQNKCYKFYPNVRLSWLDAQTVCAINASGNLTSFYSEVDYSFVVENFLLGEELEGNVWIGLKRSPRLNSLQQNQDLSWGWQDGSSSDFRKFGLMMDQSDQHWSLEPGPGSGFDCVYIDVARRSGNNTVWWNTGDCLNMTNHFLCSFECRDEDVPPVPCLPCAVGKYLTPISALESGKDAENPCLSCPSGKFGTSIGSFECTDCLAGKYSTGIGSLVMAEFDKNCIVSSCLIQSGCILTCLSGMISMAPYSDLESSMWLILPPSVVDVNLIFDEFVTEHAYDVLTVFDCQDPSCQKQIIIGSYSGSELPSLISSQYGFLLLWTSDEILSAPLYSGWVARWNTTTRTICHNCPRGAYSSRSGANTNTTCIQCQAGTYTSAVASTDCSKCPSGTYSGYDRATSSSNCSACDEGKYSSTHAANSVDFCLLCHPGSYADRTGTSNCTLCAKGRFSKVYGGGSETSCEVCASGSFSSMEGGSACFACKVGTYSTHTAAISPNTCNDCTEGKYSDISGASSSVECKFCDSGSFSAGGGWSRCSSCIPGSFANQTAKTFCSLCTAGRYADAGGSTECSWCPAGTYSMELGADNSALCIPCAAGKYSTVRGDTTCALCSAGSYASSKGSLNCTLCSHGTYLTGSGLGSQNCLQCGFGSYNNVSGSSECDRCRVGTFSSTLGASCCQSCGIGLYSNVTGASQCARCELGTYIAMNGTSACLTCASGTYTSMPASVHCTACPQGTYSSGLGTINCTQCQEGRFSNTSAASICLLCGSGTCSPRVGMDQCESCVSGKYSSGLGGIKCDPCNASTYASHSGALLCDLCAAGTYSSVEGAESSLLCHRCDAGKYSSSAGKTSCIACEQGHYFPGYIGNLTGVECQDCPAGTFNNLTSQSMCSACVAGTYSTGTSMLSEVACQMCTAGSYSPRPGSSKASECFPCTAGTFSTSQGASDCSSCIKGAYTNITGKTFCSLCTAGRYADACGSTECSWCPAGTYSMELGADNSALCIPCAAGKYSTVRGDTTCALCSAGSYASSKGSLNCTLCSHGTYLTGSGLGSQNCLQCGFGSYNNVSGSSECDRCRVGTFSSTLGASCCQSCGIGLYSNVTGASQCARCELGTYIAMNGTSACLTCASGTYTSMPASVHCTACPQGTYSSGLGTINCTQCQEGRFSNTSAASICLLCGSGTCSPRVGMDQCESCVSGKYSSGPGKSFCAQCSPGSYISTERHSTCFACSFGTYTSMPASVHCTACPQGTYSSGLGTINCTQCQEGRFSNTSAASICILCGSGTCSPRVGMDQCESCVSGKYSSGLGGIKCDPCKAGTYTTKNKAELCDLCVAGTFSVQLGSNSSGSCFACTVGSFASSEGTTACTLCDEGKFSNVIAANSSLACKECPAGQFQDFAGRTDCRLCTSGSFLRLTGQTLCSVCDTGKYSSLFGATVCSTCDQGTYASETSKSLCLMCPAGTYSTSPAATALKVCMFCDPGTYSSADGARNVSVCLLCPAGLYSSGKGATSSVDCAQRCSLGTYSTAYGSSSSSLCLACIPGLYNTAEGSTECITCEMGTFSTTISSSSKSDCVFCKAGKYSSLSGASSNSTCVECAAGYFSTAEAGTSCKVCIAGTYSLHVGSSSPGYCLTCPSGKFSHRVTTWSDEIIAYYLFDKLFTLLDSSASHLNLRNSDPRQSTSNNCMVSQACVNFSSSSGVGFSFGPLKVKNNSNMSVCLWFAAGKTKVSDQTLLYMANGQLLLTRLYDTDDLIILVHNDENNLIFYTEVKKAFQSDCWNHLCVISSLKEWNIYINGTLISSSESTGGLSSLNWTLNYIGSKPSFSNKVFNGRMQELRIYEKFLTQREVLELHSWVQRSENATSCSECWSGTFSSSTGASSPAACTSCSGGSYSELNGASVCTTCPKGTFSFEISANSTTSCQVCLAGTYTTMIKSTSCTSCEAGKYSTADGATSSNCLTCPIGQLPSEEANFCRKCLSTDNCFDWVCPGGSFRSGDNCSQCSKCKDEMSTTKPCSTYSDTYCNPCNSSCFTLSSEVTLTGFSSFTDFQAYGQYSFQTSIADALGQGISPSNIIVTSVCFGTSCEILASIRRAGEGRTVTVKFSVMSEVYANIIQETLVSGNFSQSFVNTLSQLTRRNITSSPFATSAVRCQTGFYSDGRFQCLRCTQCNNYVISCSATADSVCLDQRLSMTFISGMSVGAVVFVVFVAGISFVTLRRIWIDRDTKAFVQGIAELFKSDVSLVAATQKHLPLELRSYYESEGNLLGKGAFGIVVLVKKKAQKHASNSKLLSTTSSYDGERKYAIKIILANSKEFDEKELRQIKREKHILECLKCEHAVKLAHTEPNELAHPGFYCLVMEYLDGQNMEHVLDSCYPTRRANKSLETYSRDEVDQTLQPPESAECIEIARNVLAVLKELHDMGFVHRDIKPGNIIRYGSNQNLQNQKATFKYKLLDYGTALAFDDQLVATEHQTLKNTNKDCQAGTVAYMSPEMFLAESVDYQTDLWSLGVTLFEIACGCLPFQAEQDTLGHYAAAVAGKMGEEAPSVFDKIDDVGRRARFDKNLNDVIAKALQKHKQNRYRKADEMHQAVYECLVKKGEELYHVFISYRVASEGPFARLLFDELNHSVTPGGTRVTVYWDAERLVNGEDWEEGFSNGLLSSLCIFPLLSYGSTAPLAKIASDAMPLKAEDGWDETPVRRKRLEGKDTDWEDNVLKELMIATVLHQRRAARSHTEEKGLLQSVYPILIGRQEPEDHPNYPNMGNYFEVERGGGAYPTTSSTPTNVAVASFLRDKANMPADVCESVMDMSVERVMKGITKKQGCKMWEGESCPDLVELTRNQKEHLIGKGYTGPPVDLGSVKLSQKQRELCSKGFDELQLKSLKTQIQSKLTSFHDVIDRACRHHSANGTRMESLRMESLRMESLRMENARSIRWNESISNLDVENSDFRITHDLVTVSSHQQATNTP